MSPTTWPSRLALGYDWDGWVASNVSRNPWRHVHGQSGVLTHSMVVPQAEPIICRCDRFDANGADVLAGMAKHFRVEHASQSAQEEMLGTIQADKAHCRKLIDTIIERLWIDLGKCCGLRVQGSNKVQRPLAIWNDLRQALKAVTPPAKLHKLLRFLFNYVRNALYPATLVVTHQWAVEQATLVRLQVRFMAPPPGNPATQDASGEVVW
jgi:hypothetical protein